MARYGLDCSKMATKVDLDDLAVFVAVAETSSFSLAAGRLGVPKSSVSRAIARLEAATGVALVHRTTRHVALSTAGSALHERVAPQITSLRRSLSTLPELEEEPSGVLRLTASVDFGEAVLADVVARFVARYPAVEVDARLTNLMVDLVAEGVDLALRMSPRRLKDSSLTARKLCPLDMQLYASPTYLGRRTPPRTPRDLEGHDWVRMRNAQALSLEGPGGTATVEMRARVVGDDMSFVRSSVVAGAGIAVLPVFLADTQVAAGALVRVLPRWNVHSSDVWLVSPAGRRQPRKVTAFVDFLLESMKGRALVPREADLD